jgi:hypothetical protein
MKDFRRLLIIAAFAIIIAAAIPIARADEATWATKVTIDRPLRIDDMVLAPGSYIFRLLNMRERNTVVVYNAKTRRGDGIVMGEPAYRSHVSDKTIIKLEPEAKGAPEVLQYWYYPDSHYGIKFFVPQTKIAGMHRNAAHVAG